MIFLAPVTRRDRPCCPFPTELEKIYHQPGISARWPNVKQPHFSENHDKSQGQKVCRLKAGWLYATSAVGHRPAKPGDENLSFINVLNHFIQLIFRKNPLTCT